MSRVVDIASSVYAVSSTLAVGLGHTLAQITVAGIVGTGAVAAALVLVAGAFVIGHLIGGCESRKAASRRALAAASVSALVDTAHPGGPTHGPRYPTPYSAHSRSAVRRHDRL